MMDVLQFGRDLGSNSIEEVRDGFVDVCTVALLELKDLLLDRSLSMQDLSSAARQLELIDRHLPDPNHVCTNEVLKLGYELLKPEAERREQVRIPRWEYGRFAYCRRIADAEAFERVLSGVRKAAASGFSTELTIEVLFPRHPLVERVWKGSNPMTGSVRQVRARLRLLRIGFHYRATGEVLSLEDPLGTGPLLSERTGGRLKIWTVWLNGVNDQADDEGVGWFKRTTHPGSGSCHTESERHSPPNWTVTPGDPGKRILYDASAAGPGLLPPGDGPPPPARTSRRRSRRSASSASRPTSRSSRSRSSTARRA